MHDLTFRFLLLLKVSFPLISSRLIPLTSTPPSLPPSAPPPHQGESFFMAANEPHAYVAGEIIECMACSDNVVRAGLTPKFKDVPTLVDMLTYTQGGPNIDGGIPTGDARIQRYTPPVPEFEVRVAATFLSSGLTLLR